jgi:predicted tellurium resistance membrane protein TerC
MNIEKEKRFNRFLLKYKVIQAIVFLVCYVGFPLLARVEGLPIWHIQMLIVSTLMFFGLTSALILYGAIEYRSLKRLGEI